MMTNPFKKIVNVLEPYIPMTFGNLVLFAFLIYLLTVVGKSVVSNYKSNQDIEKEGEKLVAMRQEITDMRNAINYFETNSFKEKEAREKLGYKAPDEKVISLSVDTEEDKQADSGLAEASVKKPNYQLWWEYFFSKR